MKKVFSLLLILAMCLSMLTSCFGSEWRDQQQNGGADEALTAAADFLYNIMKDKEGAENVYDFDVVAKLVISGVTYEVTWETDNENVKIVKSTKDSYWTVDIPTTNDTAFSYKLTATIKNAEVPADTFPVLSQTAFVATIPVPASPSGGHNGTPGCNLPLISNSFAPSVVKRPAHLPAVIISGNNADKSLSTPCFCNKALYLRSIMG